MLATAGTSRRRVFRFMAEPESDDELMASLLGPLGAARDEAFRELVRRHAATVQGFVRALLGTRGDAEDVTQDVFLRVYQARERYAPGKAAFRTWLLRIARNLALNRRRDGARRRTGALEEADEVSDGEPGPARALEARLELDAVAEAVEQLPEGERELVALRFREGLSYEEMESVMGSGAAALKQKTWRALQRLRALLGVEETP